MKWIFAILIMLCGCATPQVAMYTSPYPAKSTDAEIDIYKSKIPSREYIEIGEISYWSSWTNDSNDNLEQLKSKARDIGADGIIVSGPSGYDGGRERGLKGIAIKYKE